MRWGQKLNGDHCPERGNLVEMRDGRMMRAMPGQCGEVREREAASRVNNANVVKSRCCLRRGRETATGERYRLPEVRHARASEPANPSPASLEAEELGTSV